MNRNLALLAGAAAATVATVLVRRRTRFEPGAGPVPDPRAEELRRKLAEAREAAADEEEFEAAGMGPETLVEEGSAAAPAPPAAVDEERRRVHDEARAAADEMRRTSGPESA